MLITDKKVEWFEDQQTRYGTETALVNILTEVALDLLSSLGAKRVQLTWFKPDERQTQLP